MTADRATKADVARLLRRAVAPRRASLAIGVLPDTAEIVVDTAGDLADWVAFLGADHIDRVETVPVDTADGRRVQVTTASARWRGWVIAVELIQEVTP